MGQQVGNCESFTLTHYLADLFAMHRGPRSIPLCIQYHIQLTSLSFEVSRPSHSWETAISIFYLENPRSRSLVRSKFKVRTWVQHPVNSNPVFFHVNLPSHSYDAYLFKISPWKSKVKVIAEGHIVGITPHRLISLSFDVDEPSHSYIQLFKNLIMGEVNVGSNNLSAHIPFVPCQSAIPFLRL